MGEERLVFDSFKPKNAIPPMKEEDLPDFACRLGEPGMNLSRGGRARQWWWNKITKMTPHHTTGKHISDIQTVVRGAHGMRVVKGIESPSYGKEVGYMTSMQMIKMLRDPVLAKAFLGFSHLDMLPAARQEFPRRVAGLFMALARVRSLEKWPKYAAGKGLGVLPRNTTFLDKIASYHEEHPDFRGNLKPNSFCTMDGFNRTVCGAEWDKEWRDALATWRLEADLTRSGSVEALVDEPAEKPAEKPAPVPVPEVEPPPIVIGRPVEPQADQPTSGKRKKSLDPDSEEEDLAPPSSKPRPSQVDSFLPKGMALVSILRTEILSVRSKAKEVLEEGKLDAFVGKDRKWIWKTVLGDRGTYVVFAKLRGNLKDVDPYITPPVGKLIRSGKDVEKHVAEFCQ